MVRRRLRTFTLINFIVLLYFSISYHHVNNDLIIGYFSARISEMSSSVERDSDHKERQHKPCVFCNIRNGTEVSSKIVENESAFAIVSLEGYPLIVPKAHVTADTVSEHAEDMAAASRLAFSLVSATKEALNASGISVVTNLGRSAGQQVSHVHIHLINRNNRDGKVMLSYTEPLPREELNERATRIQSFLK